MQLAGRREILTNEAYVDASNIIKVLEDAYVDHCANRMETEYLYKYYKGITPILFREKTVRPEICNRISENRANEIVSFKVGYLMGEPVQYIGMSGDKQDNDAIILLNNYMRDAGKDMVDTQIATWDAICGTAYRIVVPEDEKGKPYDAPFEVYSGDPRNTFVVYANTLRKEPMLGVTYVEDEGKIATFSCYTKDEVFMVRAGKILSSEPNVLGMIPVIEYPANQARMGSFEIVLPMLDAINNVESNRLDGIEQFVQSFLVFKGAEITSDDFATLRAAGALVVPVDADVNYLVQEMNQTQTQTLISYMYQTVLDICGMPNRNGGLSTSDTGAAVMLRDGWSAAESRAQDAEKWFKHSEKHFLKCVERIIEELRGVSFEDIDIAVQFTRRNYSNIQEKSQVLVTMLANNKIHPKLAFEHCGMFIDPDAAYQMSEEYKASHQQEVTEVKEETEDVEEDAEV